MFSQGLNITYIIVLIVSVLVAMVIHEFMHAYVGYKLGDTTAHDQGRLSLNPLNHIDPVMTIILPIVTIVLFGFPFLAAKPVPFNPARVKYGEYGAAMIAAAGPLSNLVLAFIAALLLRGMDASSFIGQVVWLFEQLNVALFVFNLIPIPPLDGSRVLYAFAPEALQDFMRRLEPMGFFIIFGLILLGGFNGILLNLMQMVLNILP
ncbi:MAG: site-2 protease family protein [Candidatus Saccharimonadales bacterium]